MHTAGGNGRWNATASHWWRWGPKAVAGGPAGPGPVGPRWALMAGGFWLLCLQWSCDSIPTWSAKENVPKYFSEMFHKWNLFLLMFFYIFYHIGLHMLNWLCGWRFWVDGLRFLYLPDLGILSSFHMIRNVSLVCRMFLYDRLALRISVCLSTFCFIHWYIVR